MTDEITQNGKREQQAASPRELLFKYLHYLPWILISLLLCLFLAFLKLRYSTPMYRVSGKLLVAKNTSPYGNNSGEKFADIFMIQSTNNNLNDEIEIIKSRAMANRVVQSLGMQIQYFNKGNIRSSIIHNSDYPFITEILHLADSSKEFSFLVKVVNDRQFQLNEQRELFYFNQMLKLRQGAIRLVRTTGNLGIFKSNEFIVNWQPIEKKAASISNNIQVAKSNDYSNVLLMSVETENPKLGIDMLNQYMEEYQNASLEDKRQIAVNTLRFIDEQLDTVRYDLGGVERNLLNYREKNQVFNPEQQSQLFYTELSETNRQLIDQGVKLRIVDNLINYISDRQNPYRKVGSMLGIEEPSLIQQVLEYNRLQVERETGLKNTPADNPYIRNIEAGIEKLRQDILENFKNIRQTYLVTQSELNRKNIEANSRIKSMPGKEKQLLEVTRQQNILQELYSYLLQKKLETSISSASTISNIKVLEPAMATSTSVSPNRRNFYAVAIFIGLLVPISIILLLEYLNDKVRSKNDVEKMTDTPILGEIGHAENAGVLVVTGNNRKFIAEQFRMIRSNLQYILPKVEKPVLMVTSSYSGEGKSFISTNLGAVLALSGKRTVILEFDIRKPKILKGLGIVSNRKGITNYIIGNVDLEEIIHPIPEVSNLFVIPCGPVPPNPAEMLLDENINALFDKLSEKFDAMIIDTAPVGLVSDAITLSRHAHASIYIVRHRYTLKKQIRLIDELFSSRKLPNMSIIINDIEAKGGYGGYYGYGQYGYGYGYGYGVNGDYFDDMKKRRNRVLNRIKKIFS